MGMAEQHRQGRRNAAQARQTLRSAGAGRNAAFDQRQAELRGCVLAGGDDAVVASERKFQAQVEAVAVDDDGDRLGQLFHAAQQLRALQCGVGDGLRIACGTEIEPGLCAGLWQPVPALGMQYKAANGCLRGMVLQGADECFKLSGQHGIGCVQAFGQWQVHDAVVVDVDGKEWGVGHGVSS